MKKKFYDYRMQIGLNNQERDAFIKLKEDLRIKNNKDFFDAAISIIGWLVQERRERAKIGSFRKNSYYEDGKPKQKISFKELIHPVLQ